MATPSEVNDFHSSDDADVSALSHHHTLGNKPTQASPGHHNHNGINSKKLMEGVTLTGAKGGNVALANLITELANVLGFTDSTT